MPDAPVAAPMVPNGPPPNAVDQRSAPPPWVQKQNNDVAAAKERLGLSGNKSSFMDRVMDPDARNGEQKAPDKPLDTRGTKVLGKDQQDKPAKAPVIKDTPPPEKTNSAEAIEKLLKGEVDAAEIDPNKEQKVEDKTPEPKVDEVEPATPEGKKAYKWGELRSKADRLDELEPKYKELEEKLKLAETTSKAKDYEELQKKYEEKMAKLASYDIQEQPEFQEHVVKPIDERYGLLEGLAKEYKLDMEAIEKALNLPEKVARNRAMAKILAESEEPIDSVSQADAARAASEIFEIRQYGSELQKNAQSAMEAMKLEREKSDGESSAKKTKEFADTAKLTFDRMQKAIPYLKDNPAEAKALFESLKPEDITKAPPAIQAYNAYAGLALTKLLPVHKAEVAGLKGQVSQLEERIRELTNGGPSLNGEQVRTDTSTATNGQRPAGVGFADWIMNPASRR